jgi:hypothetical protein
MNAVNINTAVNMNQNSNMNIPHSRSDQNFYKMNQNMSDANRNNISPNGLWGNALGQGNFGNYPSNNNINAR